jgi:hypothetical protein
MRALAWAISDLAHGTSLKVLVGAGRPEAGTAERLRLPPRAAE